MGVYIKGVEMPKSCFDCRYICGLSNSHKFTRKRHPLCPIVPVPKHGDLIDRDELLKQKWESSDWECGGCHAVVVSAYDIEDAPTVIEAELESTSKSLQSVHNLHEVDGE